MNNELLKLESEIQKLIEKKQKLLKKIDQQKKSTLLYQKSYALDGDIVIVGGKGQMGKLFDRFFNLSGYNTKSIDVDDWPNASKIVENAILVIVSVPINVTKKVIESLPKIPKKCILADFTSIKTEPVKEMLKAHDGTVIGLHPMFGPDVKSLKDQLIVWTEGRKTVPYEWLLDQFEQWGSRLLEISPQEHDKNMSIIQALRHFTAFSYGLFLMKENTSLKTLLELSSPIYYLELMMVGRLFAQDPQLYADIIFSSQQNVDNIQSYLNSFTESVLYLQKSNKSKFIEEFKKVSLWMENYSGEFLEESQKLLEKMKK